MWERGVRGIRAVRGVRGATFNQWYITSVSTYMFTKHSVELLSV